MTDPTPPRPGEEEPARPESIPTCYRHPERETYIRCQRCARHICPDCSREAAVGVQCVECVRAGSRTHREARTRFGGVVRSKGDAVTKVLIGLNLAVFLAFLGLGDAVARSLMLIGVAIGPEMRLDGGVAGGEIWRLLTSAFLHTQVWHIAINMFSLWILGRPLEHLLGRLRFLGLYLGAGLAGSAVAYALTSPFTGVLGASGAVFGLFGATVVMMRRMRADMTWIVGILALNVVLNVVYRDALSWQGHLGGFVAGLLLGFAFAYAPRERGTTWQVGGFVVVALAVVALVVWRTVELTGSALPM